VRKVERVSGNSARRGIVSWLRANPLRVTLVAVGVVVLGLVAAVLGPALTRPAHLTAARGAAPPLDDPESGQAIDDRGVSPDPSTDPGHGALGSVGPSPSSSNRAAGRPPSSSGFPGPANTGVPAATRLSAYNGPCTITADSTVIDAKTVNCDLQIRAKGVVIRKSKVNGIVGTEEGTPYSFTLEDSEVSVGVTPSAAVASTNMTIRRSNIHGGATSVYCYANCTVTDSWLHGQHLDPNEPWHLNAFLANDNGPDPGGRTNAVLRHNTLLCDAPPNHADGGCSGDVNLFGDFGPVTYVTVDNNLFDAFTGISYCVYGGSSEGKHYDADHIVFVNNVFRRGSNNKCGAFGPVTSFNVNRPGNQWADNVWDDGTSVAAQH
jgi:hypothetical protein